MNTTDINIVKKFLSETVSSVRPFFCCRMPGETSWTFNSPEYTLGGMVENSFVIFPFDNDTDSIVSIPMENTAIPYPSFSVYKKNAYPFPHRSTTRDEHRGEILHFQQLIGGESDRKIIAARAICVDVSFEIASSFLSLSDSYPDAFVFIFRTEASGLWMGASPETLLRGNGRLLETMSLAGTRKSGQQGQWDGKNIMEQKIVTEYVVDTLRDNGFTPAISPVFTKKAGPVEHLCTRIETTIPEIFGGESLARLLLDLSPTAALCGYPKDMALNAILQTECFSRGYYGGFCGLYFTPSIFDFFVNLRSLRIDGGKACLFSGGGITRDSDPEAEWMETEMKSRTLLDKLCHD